AVRCRHDFADAVEHIGAVAGYTWLSKGEQKGALWTEFVDDVALAVSSLAVGRPEVAIAVEMEAMRLHEHPVAQAADEVPCRIEFENRRLRAMDHPQIAASIKFQPADLPPFHARGKLRPILHSAIRIWRGSLCRCGGREQPKDQAEARDSDGHASTCY